MFRSCTSRVGLLLILGAVLAAVSAPGAFAAQRYASPVGSDTDCSAAKPCDLHYAVVAAKAGDEVIVKPGTYDLASNLDDPAPITIHGVAGQPRPHIVFFAGTNLLLQDSTLSYIEVDQSDPATRAATTWGTHFDQVILRGGSAADCAVSVFDGTMRNSIVVTQSPNGSAICSGAWHSTNTSTYRNVTAIAKGGVAIEAYAMDSTATMIANVINTIARTDPGGAGLEIRTENPGAHATLTVSHTNYANYWSSGTDVAYVDGGGNQSIPPSFVNPAAGDYHQKAGSVTIDAGLWQPANGLVDVDGDWRLIDNTDIGADEFVAAPTAATGAASAVTEASAALTGSVNAKGSPTKYHFEYGTTTAYGMSTPAGDAGFGVNPVAVNAAPGGLSPETTYHYRLVASNAGGVATGGDQTFTTSAAPAPGSTGSAGSTGSSGSTGASGGSGEGFAGVKLISTRLTFAGRFIAVRLSCPAGTIGRCAGITKLTARRPGTGSSAAAPVKLGRAAFSIAPGAQAKVRLRVTRAGRRLLTRSRRLRGKAASEARTDAGQSRTTVAVVTIRRRSR